MFGIRYQKSPPTTYVALYKSGQIKRSGPGLSFFYYAPTSELIQIPLAGQGVPFVFSETTSDFQEVTIQGELTYRIANPEKLAKLLDYSITSAGQYRSEDPQKLSERLTHIAQKFARSFVQLKPLREVLISADELVEKLSSDMQGAASLSELGVELIQLAILAIKPIPEMAKALQAEARERLLRTADEAIYERRNNSVLLERTIKENELQTELAVQLKQREVEETRLHTELKLQETKLSAAIAREEERAAFVEQSSKNKKVEAEARAFALKSILEPLAGLDWRTMLAMGNGDSQAQNVIALAFQELATNAEKIKELSITPELLGSLMKRHDQPQ